MKTESITTQLSEDLSKLIKQELGYRMLNVSQDYVGGIFYYGIQVGEKPLILTSDPERRYIKYDELSHLGMKPEREVSMQSRFSGEGVLCYLQQGERSITLHQLFKELLKYFRTYLILSDDDQYVLLSLWSMATYIYQAFNYFPYLHINGEKGSGKSQALELLNGVCFNATLSIGMNPAPMFRKVEATSGTIIMDEMEWLGKAEADRNGAVMDVLKAGFRKNAVVDRCGGSNWEIVKPFRCYCPKILAGISSLENVLKERTIGIRLKRKLPEEKIEKYTCSDKNTEMQQHLRDGLYCFGLIEGASLADKYQNRFEEIRGLEGAHERNSDLWAPIMVIANYLDNEIGSAGEEPVTDCMRRLTYQHIDERIETDECENSTVMLAKVLDRYLLNCSEELEEGMLTVMNQEFMIHVNQQPEFLEKQIGVSKLTQLLKTFDVKTKVKKIGGETKRVYIFDPEKVKDTVTRYTSQNESVTQSVTTKTQYLLSDFIKVTL